MTQIVFVDVLIVLNTVVTFIMLLTTASLTGVKNSTGRMVLGAITGGLFSLVLLAPQMSAPYIFLTKAAMAVALVGISFKIQSIKRFFICIALFLGVNLFYAGVMYGIDCLFAPSFISTKNGFSYFNIGSVGIIVLCCTVYAVVRILKKYVLPDSRKPRIYNVTLFYDGKSTQTKALLDTGNSVTDMCGGDVIIVDAAVASELIGCDEKIFSLSGGEILPILGERGIYARFIPVKMLGTGKVLAAFTAEKAVIETETGSGVLKKPCIAVAEGCFDELNYDALLAQNVII